MASGAHEEYLDCDTSTDELFVYYLRVRAFDLEKMIEDYFALWGITIPIYDDFNVYMSTFVRAYGGLLEDPLMTQRLTEAEQKDILNYIKYQKTAEYNALTPITLERNDYGNNIERNGAIHWNLFLRDYLNCDFEWLINAAINEDGLTLENFPCDYTDTSNATARAQECTDYNTYINGFVLEGDKQKKEKVSFKLFLKNYNPPVGHDTTETTLQDDFYNQLISDTIHSHTKNNVISRLANSKRWKRRVLFKLPPYRTLPSHD